MKKSRLEVKDFASSQFLAEKLENVSTRRRNILVMTNNHQKMFEICTIALEMLTRNTAYPKVYVVVQRKKMLT